MDEALKNTHCTQTNMASKEVNVWKQQWIYGSKINYVDSERNIGVIIDKRLKWTEHITTMTLKRGETM